MGFSRVQVFGFRVVYCLCLDLSEGCSDRLS